MGGATPVRRASPAVSSELPSSTMMASPPNPFASRKGEAASTSRPIFPASLKAGMTIDISITGSLFDSGLQVFFPEISPDVKDQEHIRPPSIVFRLIRWEKSRFQLSGLFGISDDDRSFLERTGPGGVLPIAHPAEAPH